MFWSITALQVTLFALSGLAAFLLRFDFRIPVVFERQLMFAVPLWIVLKTSVFWLRGLNRGWWKFVSVVDVRNLVFANGMASAASAIMIWLVFRWSFPRSIYFIDFIITILATAGVRICVRMAAEAMAQNVTASGARRVFIYGAGDAGAMLLREIRSDSKSPYRVCGYIDDNLSKKNVSIQGIPVLGAGVELSRLAVKHEVQEVLIAVPSANGTQMTGILKRCQAAGTRCKTIPPVASIISCNRLANQIREVAVEDLLGRSPIHLDEAWIRAKLTGRVVAVTGAAGSIGAELCRQIARFEPEAIVAYEISESALYHLNERMRWWFPEVKFCPEIGSIQNERRLREVFEQYQPKVLYHAAAYKHVPMMETNPFEAVENNIFGTYRTATAALDCGMEDFVMISSDKAVRPASVMGATKRVAELLIASLQNGGTNFVSVRFGNVLGSNGSVVPLFKEQILRGGPVTVTHPEMRRYFMTIAEAVQLVLQAAAMGKGGEIFVLDMGQPVKIVDLARNLILLSGFRPEDDIRIEFTGIRPGEKLYEELSTIEENTVPTCHEKIKVFRGPVPRLDEMDMHLRALERACAQGDLDNLVLELRGAARDFQPGAHLPIADPACRLTSLGV